MEAHNAVTVIEINQRVADQLREIADLLAQQNANPYRVNAYRQAAATIAQLDVSVQDIVERKGLDGLVAIPGIGKGIGRSVYEYVATERMTRLEALRGGADPEMLLQTVPGIGPRLAQRIHHDLQIESLEALELAAHNGRLESLHGIGKRKIEALRASLESILGRRRSARVADLVDEPPVEILLAIDTAYRDAADADTLPKIAPKRFNPEGRAWLPVLHASRKGWHFTALYSNTARAHELGMTHDWVVIYFYDEHHQEGQHTVVTETRGSLIGKRVVRGREAECRAFYATFEKN